MSGRSLAGNHFQGPTSQAAKAYTAASSSFGPVIPDLLPAIPFKEISALSSSIYSISHLPKMVDPVSLLASIIAISEAGVKISISLYKFSSAFKGSLQEIDTLATEIDAFSTVLEELYDWLEDNQGQISGRALTSANKILRSCKIIFQDVKQMVGKGDGLDNITFWNRVRWTFRREKVMPMKANLETFKTTLMLLLHTMQLAQCKSSRPADGSEKAVTRKEMKLAVRVERGIRSQCDALGRWEMAERTVQAELMIRHVSKQQTWNPVHNSAWLKNLMPTVDHLDLIGKPYLALPGIPNTLNSPHTEETVIKKTIDVLLSNWTNIEEGSSHKTDAQSSTNNPGSGLVLPSSKFEATSRPIVTGASLSTPSETKRIHTNNAEEFGTSDPHPVSTEQIQSPPPIRRTVYIEEDGEDAVVWTYAGTQLSSRPASSDNGLVPDASGPTQSHATGSKAGNATVSPIPRLAPRKLSILSQSEPSTRRTHTNIDISHVRSPSPTIESLIDSGEEAARSSPAEVSPHYAVVQQPPSLQTRSSPPLEFDVIYPNELTSTLGPAESASGTSSLPRRQLPRSLKPARDLSPSEDSDSADEFLVLPDQQHRPYSHPRHPHHSRYTEHIDYTQSQSPYSGQYPPNESVQSPYTWPPIRAAGYPQPAISSPYTLYHQETQPTAGHAFSHPGYFSSTYPSQYDSRYGQQGPYLLPGYGSQPPAPTRPDPSVSSAGTDTETEPPKPRILRETNQRKSRAHKRSGPETRVPPSKDMATQGQETAEAAEREKDFIIRYVNAIGEKFEFPFARCHLWKDMELLAREAHHPGEEFSDHFSMEDYHLLDPDGNIILPTLWEDSIMPGWTVTLQPKANPRRRKVEPGSVADILDHNVTATNRHAHTGEGTLDSEQEIAVGSPSTESDHKHKESPISGILRADTPPQAVRNIKDQHFQKAPGSSCDERSDYGNAGADTSEDCAESADNGADQVSEYLLEMIPHSQLWGEGVRERLKKAHGAESSLAQARLRRRVAKIMFNESIAEYHRHRIHDPDLFVPPADTDEASSTISESPGTNAGNLARHPHNTIDKGGQLPQLLHYMPSHSSAGFEVRQIQSPSASTPRPTNEFWEDAASHRQLVLPQGREDEGQLSMNHPRTEVRARGRSQVIKATQLGRKPPESTAVSGSEITPEQKIGFLTSLIEKHQSDRQATDSQLNLALDEQRLRRLEEILLNHDHIRQYPYPFQLSPYHLGFPGITLANTPSVAPLPGKSDSHVPLGTSGSERKQATQNSFRRGLKQRFRGGQ